jgi:hypothetical protein
MLGNPRGRPRKHYSGPAILDPDDPGVPCRQPRGPTITEQDQAFIQAMCAAGLDPWPIGPVTVIRTPRGSDCGSPAAMLVDSE